MAVNFVSLIFIWLLLPTASSAVTPGQNHNFTNAMTGEVGKFTHNQLTTQETSRYNPLSEVSGRNIIQSPTEEKTTKPSTKPSLQTTPMMAFLPNIQTAATLNPTSSQINSSTEGMKSTTEVKFKVPTSATTVVTNHGSNPTTTTRVPPMLSRSTQTQDTGKTSTSQLTSDKMTHPSTHPTQSSNTTSTKPVENKSTSTSPVTGGDAMQSTGLYRTSTATTKTPFIHITKATKRQNQPDKNAKSKKGTNHSRAVAGLIGGALVLMMVGFLAIYIKKRKLQSQQISTRDWAGPSPFLDGGVDNGQVTLRTSNRISLSSILPQRLSKRLSLLPETDEELEDMTPGTTFGDKNQGRTFGCEVDGNDAQESNGTAAAVVVVPQMESTGDAPETAKN